MRIVLAHVLKAPNDAGRHRDGIPVLESRLVLALVAPVDAEPAVEAEERLGRRVVRVQTRALAGRAFGDVEREVDVADRR